MPCQISEIQDSIHCRELLKSRRTTVTSSHNNRNQSNSDRIEGDCLTADMPGPGLPPCKRRHSGRARTLTAEAQQYEQDEEEAVTYREDEEWLRSDAMKGVLMMTGDPVREHHRRQRVRRRFTGDHEHRDDRHRTPSTTTGNKQGLSQRNHSHRRWKTPRKRSKDTHRLSPLIGKGYERPENGTGVQDGGTYDQN